MRLSSHQQLQRPSGAHCARLALFAAIAIGTLAEAILVQPNNYMLDDSPLTSQHDAAGSLSPFYNDQTGANEQTADKDIVSIIGDGLARLRFARMLEQQHAGQEEPSGQLSQEMAELIQEGQQQQQAAAAKGEQGEQQSLSSSMANMLMNVAQAAAAAAQSSGPNEDQRAGANQQDSRSQIMELDTNQAGPGASSQASKSDLKSSGPSQWYNPKETIPVLKISSMATPSKYKKVYFRSEKKLVDGAFHSAASEQEQKKPALVAKPLSSAVQRRSSRGSAGGAPPGVLQDGVIDFLKKFRDVYVQTRPAGAASSSGSSLAANLVSAASSPFAAFLAPASAGSRPNLASAISTASQMVNSAAMLSQAASSVAAAPASAGGSSAAASTAAGAASSSTAAAGSGPSKSPLSAQTYVSFWSKTFPTWVRKMLKQMRRRSLYNSSKRQQQQQHHQHAHGIGQKAAGSSAVSNVVADSSSQSSSGSSSS